MGPGISTDAETVQLLQELLPSVKIPLIIDADAGDEINTLDDVLPGDDFDGDFSSAQAVGIDAGDKIGDELEEEKEQD